MAEATVEICESNTVGETVTHNVTNINYGSSDAPNLVTATYPITRGTNSYEKYERLHVTAMGTSTKIDNIQIWKSAGTLTLGTGGDLKVYLKTSAYTAIVYATPVTTTSTQATITVPTADPTAANLGIAGVLTGSLTAVGYSDYFCSQIQTISDAPIGAHAQLTWVFQYDEQ